MELNHFLNFLKKQKEIEALKLSKVAVPTLPALPAIQKSSPTPQNASQLENTILHSRERFSVLESASPL